MKYIIDIPKPCHEDWDKMPPKNDGRYCDVCKKTIFDFTNLSNRELVNKLENGENVCARYKASQLNVDLFANKNQGVSKWMYLLGLTSIFTVSTPVYSQTIDSIETVHKTPFNKKLNNQINSIQDTIHVKGKVQDEMGPLPGANVISDSSPVGIQTNFDGEFSIDLIKKVNKKNYKIEISYIGYETQEIIVSNDVFLEVNLLMDKDAMLMGEVVICRVKKDNVFRKIGRWFKRKNKN